MTKDLRHLPHADQLKEACKLTRARWAVWLEAVPDGWYFLSQAGMQISRLESLQALLKEPGASQWIAGAISSGRIRWRDTGSQAGELGVRRLYCFPNQAFHQVLLAGADLLDKNSEGIFRLLAAGAQQQTTPTADKPASTSISSNSGHHPHSPEPPTQPLAAYQLIQQSEPTVEALLQALGKVDSTQDKPALLISIVQQARQLIGARGVEICLSEPQQDMPFPPAESAAPWTIPESQAPSIQLTLVRADLPWLPAGGEAVSSSHQVAHTYIASTGSPLLVKDYNAWAAGHRLEQAQAARRQEIMRSVPVYAVMGVPLKVQNEVIGTLLLIDDRPEKVFHEIDLSLLELLALQAGLALHNLELAQELQERSQAQSLAESRLVRTARLAAVGEMVAGIAHELNNPLTTVTGFIELALKDLPEGMSQRADLELALQEALRARSVVRRLLDFSRPSQDQRVPTDMNELISQVLTLIRHLLRTGGITLRMELWDELPWVPIDPGQIQQVLHNLMQNAIQAMPDGGTLVVRTSPVQRNGLQWISIAVQDSGVGIPPENLEHIFEPFFSTRAENNAGTGLGLSVSYGIIKSHNGLIEVESTLGKGSLFTVYLPEPARAAEVQAGRTTRAENVLQGSEQIRIQDLSS